MTKTEALLDLNYEACFPYLQYDYMHDLIESEIYLIFTTTGKLKKCSFL